MKLKTKHFGEIEIDQENVIRFPNGVLGFKDMKRFIVIYNPNPELPFHWLQSIDDGNLTFVICSPFLFADKYEFDIPRNVEDELNLKTPEDVLIYSITVILEDMAETSINLKAPVIINTKEKRAMQIVLESEAYPVRYKIFKKEG